MLLANAIGGMLGSPARAEEIMPEEEPDLGDGGLSDDGDW